MLKPISSPVFHILLALAEEERHGYGIILEIERRSEGAVRLGTGTLYTASSAFWPRASSRSRQNAPTLSLTNERRRYYRLTPRGREVVVQEARRLETLVSHARAKKFLPATRDSR